MADRRTLVSTLLTLALAVSTATAGNCVDGFCGGNCAATIGAMERNESARARPRTCCCRGKVAGRVVCACRRENQPATTSATTESSRQSGDRIVGAFMQPIELVADLPECGSASHGERFFLSPSPRTLHSRLCIWRI